MPTKISCQILVNVTGGPSVKEIRSIEVEAYAQINVTVPPDVTTTVNVQLGDNGQFLVITASDYANLSYKVDGGPKVKLDGPHIFFGSGAITLLGATQNDFAFTNEGSADVSVSILFGRDATD